jgi:hypothetical protein
VLAYRYAPSLPSSGMHKDKPPGIFDFAERSIWHLIGLGVGVGFLLGIFTYVAISIWQVDNSEGTRPRDKDGLESATAKLREPTPPAPPEVQY